MMGCDIHVHVEVKINGTWHHYNQPDTRRNYELFAKMAGVRNWDDSGIEPISPPRGLPEDASFTTQFDNYAHWGDDGHSHSYLALPELVELKEWAREQNFREELPGWWFEEQFGFLFSNSITQLDEYRKGYPEGVEDVRLVFWFDN